MKKRQEKSPAKELETFLNFVDNCKAEYKYAYDVVGEEDRRLQDLLHEMEFSKNEAEKNRVGTKIRRSRRLRRVNKDTVKRNEEIVKFFDDPKNREILNRIRQLLGRQRKEEEHLNSERTYKPRVGTAGKEG